MKWIRRAAEQGVPDVQLNIGNVYFLGELVTADPVEAVRWYRRAAGRGHVQSQFSLASMYSTGNDVGQDYVLAYMWCTLSDVGSGARRCDDRVTGKMTTEQVARAKELACKFVPRKERAAYRSSETVR